MSRHDEHGPPVDVEREHGPEWDAMGAEVCTCGHRADEHMAHPDGDSQTFPCGHHEGGIGWESRCSCMDCELAGTT